MPVRAAARTSAPPLRARPVAIAICGGHPGLGSEVTSNASARDEGNAQAAGFELWCRNDHCKDIIMMG